jgi:hypothetical protein
MLRERADSNQDRQCLAAARGRSNQTFYVVYPCVLFGSENPKPQER